MNARRVAAIVLLLIATGVVVRPAVASPIRWLTVQLGTHRFGHANAPEAIVARAAADDVGFECGKPSACSAQEPPPGGSCGCIDVLPQGPTSFALGRKGSIWLFDGVRHRLLEWRRGRPAAAARAVPLPTDVRDSDLAIGRDGTIYLFGNNVPHRPYLWLFALRRSGALRWKAATTVGSSQARLMIGPDGALYAVGPSASATWTPLTTSTGRPLPLAAQRRRSSHLQPLTESLRLLQTQVSDHEAHFALVDRSHRVLRAWRVRSRTAFSPAPLVSALVGDDLVVGIDMTSTGKPLRWERLVLRLGSSGGVRQQLVLDGHAVWDPDGTTARTTLRLGADGRLYELRTDPAKGLTIATYALGRR
jgi:hypothetical protein